MLRDRQRRRRLKNKMSPANHPNIRPTTPADSATITQLIQAHWGEDRVISRGKIYQPSALPGFVAESGGQLVGLLTYHLDGDECEIVTINAIQPFQGVGTRLLTAVKEKAQAAGCRRLWLITTNDNRPALRFYQRRGFVLAAIHCNAIEKSRELKPGIPHIGLDGIPIQDEIELEIGWHT